MDGEIDSQSWSWISALYGVCHAFYIYYHIALIPLFPTFNGYNYGPNSRKFVEPQSHKTALESVNYGNLRTTNFELI